MNLKPFVAFRIARNGFAYHERALYKNIPIQLLDEARDELRRRGIKYRIRYRGPRNDPRDTRSSLSRQLECAPKFANRFSVYPKGV